MTTHPLLIFRRIGREALLLPPSRFLVIGDEMLVSGVLPTKCKKASAIGLTKEAAQTQVKDIPALFQKADSLGTSLIVQFTLPSRTLQRLKALSDELSSTHVRFFLHPDRGVVARLFDVRVGSDILLPRLKRIHAAATVTISKKQTADFSLTVTAVTLCHLPNSDLLVSIYGDGMMEAEPVTSKFSHVFWCRDQGVSEPYTSFQHETLERTVYFVSHPSH